MAQKIVFIGGGDYRKDDLEEIGKLIIKNQDFKKTFLIIPFATEKEKYSIWFEQISKHFNRYGFKNFDILNYEDSKQFAEEKIKNADVLFFTGGKPDLLIKILEEKKLIKQIKLHSGTLIGVSAGALAFCKDCVITKDEDYPESIIVEGIGLVDFSVSVHYKKSEDGDLLKFSENRKIYAIKDKSALIFENSRITLVGNVFLFNNKKKIKLSCFSNVCSE